MGAVQRIEVPLRPLGMAICRRTFVGFVLANGIRAASRSDDPGAIEEYIFAAVNCERRARKLPTLTWSESLAAEARRHSEEMERKRFFSHTDPRRGGVGQRLEKAGIAYSACGENLYAQSRMENAAAAAMKAWMRSRGHRSNLLSAKYRETAVGFAMGLGGHCSVTQIFLSQPVAT